MKKSIFTSVLMILAICSACTSKVNKQETTTQEDVVDVEEVITNESSLNEIRFADWGDEEWSDNEYIKAVRKHIDKLNNGEITDEMIEPLKHYLQGKFVITYMEPSYYGGAMVQFFFIDNPDIIFSSWVYSSVDVSNKAITDYEVRGSITIADEYTALTKEEVMENLEKNPQIRVW